MLLKRIYNWDAPKKDWTMRIDACEPCKGKGMVVNEACDGVVPCPEKCDSGVLKKSIPPVVAIKILNASPVMHFSPRLIEQGSMQGWLTVSSGKVILKGVDGEVSYKITDVPGFFCCHCNMPLTDELASRLHIKETHGKKKSPDPSNPSGYRKDNFYNCVKEG